MPYTIKQGEMSCDTFPEAIYAGCMMVEEGVTIRRYDREPLPFTDDEGKEQKWFPDFIVNHADGREETVEVMIFDTLDEYEKFQLKYRQMTDARAKYKAHPWVRLINSNNYRVRYNDLVKKGTIPLFYHKAL